MEGFPSIGSRVSIRGNIPSLVSSPDTNIGVVVDLDVTDVNGQTVKVRTVSATGRSTETWWYKAEQLTQMSTVSRESELIGIDVVFDGPPGHESGRFVEVEDEDGRGIGCGRWRERDDGYWALRFMVPSESVRR
jgi:hypothetical protein